MKITLEPYSGGKYTAETEAEHVSTVIHLFKGLLVATGYHPETVDMYFNTDEEWFPPKDEEVVATNVKVIEDIEDIMHPDLSPEGIDKEHGLVN